MFDSNMSNIRLILAHPADAKEILGNIQKKELLGNNIIAELRQYISSGNLSNSMGLFGPVNLEGQSTALKLIKFITSEKVESFTPQDLNTLTEPDSFLEGIVSRCRDAGIELPEKLEKDIHSTMKQKI